LGRFFGKYFVPGVFEYDARSKGNLTDNGVVGVPRVLSEHVGSPTGTTTKKRVYGKCEFATIASNILYRPTAAGGSRHFARQKTFEGRTNVPAICTRPPAGRLIL